MKKILLYIILISIYLIIPNKIYAISTDKAKEIINLDRLNNLTLNYNYNDYNFNNTLVKIYYIASINKDLNYQLSNDFIDYQIKINNIKSSYEWDILKQTIASYIEADNIKETIEKSIEDNTLYIDNLKSGLYFIKTEKIDTLDYTLEFDSILINIPDLQEDGTWNYDISIYPKAKEHIKKYDNITYTVIKEWQDNKINRPENIEIEIYKDGLLVDNQILSSNNNWMYKWNTLDDGSTWTVVERNIPTNYNVSISKDNLNFIIINTDSTYQEENPKTSDNIKLSLYLLLASILGIVLSVLGLKSKK